MTTTRALQEVIFVIHFNAIPPLTAIDLAAWYAEVREDFPIVQQQPAWEPFNWSLIPGPIMLFPQVQTPRLVAMSGDQRRALHLQADRFAYTWRRLEPTGEITPYPGFETVLAEALKQQERFRKWWRGHFEEKISPKVVEINYSNAFPMSNGEEVLRISDILIV